MPARTGDPVTIRGTRYPSHTAAARALGITRQAIGAALDAGRLDALGAARAGPRPVRVGDAVHRSINAAAQALGLCNETLRTRLHRAGRWTAPDGRDVTWA